MPVIVINEGGGMFGEPTNWDICLTLNHRELERECLVVHTCSYPAGSQLRQVDINFFFYEDKGAEPDEDKKIQNWFREG